MKFNPKEVSGGSEDLNFQPLLSKSDLFVVGVTIILPRIWFIQAFLFENTVEFETWFWSFLKLFDDLVDSFEIWWDSDNICLIVAAKLSHLVIWVLSEELSLRWFAEEDRLSVVHQFVNFLRVKQSLLSDEPQCLFLYEGLLFLRGVLQTTHLRDGETLNSTLSTCLLDRDPASQRCRIG